jgi:hypothetical protein
MKHFQLSMAGLSLVRNLVVRGRIAYKAGPEGNRDKTNL